MTILLLLLSLAGFVCSIIIIIEAFRDEVWKGLLALFIPFYLLYYAFVEFDHEYRGLVLTGALLGSIAGIVIRVM